MNCGRCLPSFSAGAEGIALHRADGADAAAITGNLFSLEKRGQHVGEIVQLELRDLLADESWLDILAAVCALVIGTTRTWPSRACWSCRIPTVDAYYNLLVQGFRAWHLSLNKAALLGLTQLADPYGPGLQISSIRSLALPGART